MENQKALMLRQQSGISTVLINRINDISQHASILGDLKPSIRQAVDSPSFNQLLACGANLKETRQILAVLISKYANMLTVGGNLRPEHPMQYAESIIDDNPTMSLDDFNILLSNGVKGKYNEPGKLFRFDISVIYEWIGCYQDEFWELKESLPKNKTALELLSDEQLTEIQKAVKSSQDRIVTPITEKQIRDEGREKPKKPEYNPPDQNYLKMAELKMRYGREHCDLHTGRTLTDHPTFDEFLNYNQ